MKEAKYYKKLSDNRVQCELCPHNCIIENGKRGLCRVRKNYNGILIAETYGLISAIHLDPIEKKPLYRFYPDTKIISIGTVGCNMRCEFCQNHEISQVGVDEIGLKKVSVNEIIEMVKNEKNSIGLAYTYNEPTIYFEFMLDLAKEVKKLGLKNVMVSNGFINKKPLSDLLEYIDAFNIDLKAFDNNFYSKITKSNIEPIKESLKLIKKSGKHLEITNLLIPTLNDNLGEFENMCKWISEELGRDTVLHITRYFSNYKMIIEPTGIELMRKCYDIAIKYLDFVYLGNV
ncbi:AmmeMemoRadiSam system radical SAM enzyme [Haliovirga abyssi]|uniref:AmmeMemoRadiSam system radical SAM enzyme n=1 Tax=Haliovirga abyssi TaxID=2996794 RepID=A0AAU9DUG8_9FUSO|nr:AmmeMemoRadiSam system radical SAM enzyme [Haliovirga abyssi]BDU50934.1 AmmeMemoRadiSam system radical SAM enzyme [Haliovirga abyssi]